MAQSSLDVVSSRQQPLSAENASVQLLSDFLKHQLGQLQRGQHALPELVGRMKSLVNQEFRILDTCTKFNEACEEIVEACRSTDPVPDSLLSDMLEEVMDYCQTLQIFSQQRKSNVDAIIQMEKQNLEEFRRLHSSIECEHQTRTALAAVGVGAVGAVAMAASGPVALVAVALLGLAGGKSLQTHRSAANQVQQALMADMQMKNVPVQCMETFAKNLDDAVERIACDGARISGRNARIMRRMDMILEEIQGVQTAASQNFLNLASDATLTAAFGINEQRRLLIAEQCVARASAALPGIAGNVGGA